MALEAIGKGRGGAEGDRTLDLRIAKVILALLAAANPISALAKN